MATHEELLAQAMGYDISAPAPATTQDPAPTTSQPSGGITFDQIDAYRAGTGPNPYGTTSPAPTTTQPSTPSSGGLLSNPPTSSPTFEQIDAYRAGTGPNPYGSTTPAAPAPAPGAQVSNPYNYQPPAPSGQTYVPNSTGSSSGYNGISTTTVQNKPATLANVDYNTETVEGRIQGLLSKENPVIKQAENRAMQQFAARGLLNTSMAIQAANEAMVSRAVDIASPDAAAYRNQTLANQTAQNQYGQDENKQTYGLQTQNNDALIKSGLLGQEYTAKGGLQAQSDAAAYARTQLTEAGALERAKLDAQQNKDLNDLNSAKIYVEQTNAINHDYTAAVNNVQMDTKMTPQQKTDAITELTNQRNDRIALNNRVSQSLPAWQDDWAAIPVAGSATTATGSTTGTTTTGTTTTGTTSSNAVPVSTPAQPTQTYVAPTLGDQNLWANTYGG